MKAQRQWSVIGAPIDSAGGADEEAASPAALRAAGLVERLSARDLGDFGVPLSNPARDPNGVLGFEGVVEFSEALRQPVAGAVSRGELPLVLGGDCTLLIGVFAGLRDAGERPGLWFVDGHADFYDGRSSPTGEAADMELAILTGHGPKGLVDIAGKSPLVRPEAVTILGHRPASVGQDVAKELGFVPDEIDRVDAAAVSEQGASDTGRKAERRLAAVGRSWLHVDLDVLDSELFPAVSYPQPGGLNWQDLIALVGPLAGSPALLGASIADLNTARDPDGACAAAVVDRLTPLLAPR
jgi:arginase